MDLLILDGPTGPWEDRGYRGTYRASPSHCDALPEDHEINRLFFWYLEESSEDGLVHDFAKARRFAELWNQQPGDRRYEIVEVTEEKAPPVGGGEFVGFDISTGAGYSFVGALHIQPAQVGALQEPLRTLDELLIAHFAPRLNSNLLFSTYEDASFCLRVIKALNTLWPSTFESGDLSEFKAFGLYKLWPK